MLLFFFPYLCTDIFFSRRFFYMQKYIRVTGIDTGSPEYTGTCIFRCSNIIGICRAGVSGGTNAAFGVTSLDTQTKVVYKDANNTDSVSVVNHASSATEAESVAMANYIKDLVVKAWQQPHPEPFVTINTSDAPLAITNVSPAGI